MDSPLKSIIVRIISISARFEGNKFFPKHCSTFRFNANFSKLHPGHYYVVWDIELLKNHQVPLGLNMQATVTYNEGEESSDCINTSLNKDFIEKLSMDFGGNLEFRGMLENVPEAISEALCMVKFLNTCGFFSFFFLSSWSSLFLRISSTFILPVYGLMINNSLAKMLSRLFGPFN